MYDKKTKQYPGILQMQSAITYNKYSSHGATYGKIYIR